MRNNSLKKKTAVENIFSKKSKNQIRRSSHFSEDKFRNWKKNLSVKRPLLRILN
jgi:hypothetical protein